MFDVLVRAFFSDNGLSAGLAKANAGLAQLGRSGPGARAGLRAVEMGARQLAFEAAGLAGPIGRVSAGLLQMQGGSALVLGVVAGVGAIAGAYKLASQSGNELRETNERLNESWRDVVARGKPLVALQNEILKAQEDEARARERLVELAARAAAPIGMSGRLAQAAGLGVTGNELATAQANLDAAARRTLALTARIPELERDAAKAKKQQADEAERALRAETARLFLLRQIALEGRLSPIPFGAAALGPRRGGEGVGAPFAKSDTGEKFAPREFFLQDLEKAITRPQRQAPDPARLAAEAVALLGALKQGGIGNIVGGVGGGLTALSGLKGLGSLSPFGIIGTALGGVFNLFDHSEERRHKELLKAMTDLKPIMEATRAAVYLVDSRTGETRQLQYAIGRREDRDAIDRNGEGL